MVPSAVFNCLLDEAEGSGMKFHDLGEVVHKIEKTVVAGIRMILVPHSFLLQLLMQRGGPFFEAVVVLLAAVEINVQLPQGGSVFCCENEGAIVFPVLYGDRASENSRQQLAERSSGAHCRIELLRRLGD